MTCAILAFTLFLSVTLSSVAAAQSVGALRGDDLVTLVLASQSVCTDYDADSDTCGSVSYYRHLDGSTFNSIDLIALPPDFAEILFGTESESWISDTALLKLVLVGSVRVSDKGICWKFSPHTALAYASADAHPWIDDADRLLGDVTQKVIELTSFWLEGEIEGGFGIDANTELCDLAVEQVGAEGVREFKYETMLDGISLADKSTLFSGSMVFLFSPEPPNLRMD